MSSNAAKEVKGQSNGTGAHDQVTKPSVQEEKLQPLPANIQNESSSGNGGSLANLWGRASSKSKPNSAPADGNVDFQVLLVGSYLINPILLTVME